jgi:putative transposase
MPRKARIDAPGAVHHIMARGIGRRQIFRSDADRDDFVDRLSHVLVETQTPCYAWALIPNHFHLLLKTGAVPVAAVMRRLLSGYAQCFNRRHRRHGHLFQNRYKSILCQEDAYLLALVRYIHLNPLRAGVVDGYRRLPAYRYCGHGVLLGTHQIDFQHTGPVLHRFAKTVKAARTRYGEFVKEGMTQGKRPELSGGGLVRSAGGWSAVKMMRKAGLFQKADERILGDGDFVQNALSQANEQFEGSLRLTSRGYDFAKIVERVADLLEMPTDEVLSAGKQRRRVKARAMVCYWACAALGMRQTALARKFAVSQPAICAAVRNGEKIVKANQFKLGEETNL